jgi:predicted AAA+ superfamily ATPase
VLNLSEVARECRVNRKTVEGYLGVLEELLLAFRVPVFTRRARRETTRQPKLFLSDVGIFRALRQLYRGTETLEIDGVRCVPCGEYLQGLLPGSGIP